MAAFLGEPLEKSSSIGSSDRCDLAHFGAAEVGGAAHRSPLQHPVGGPGLQVGIRFEPTLKGKNVKKNMEEWSRMRNYSL